MTSLSLIGYWRANADSASKYPSPQDWIDPDWDEGERFDTWFYFVSGTLFRTFMGHSTCRICGEKNGAVEYTDGTYVWPEGLAHYIYDHAVRLPAELITHARRRQEPIEDLDPTLDWWLGATPRR